MLHLFQESTAPIFLPFIDATARSSTLLIVANDAVLFALEWAALNVDVVAPVGVDATAAATTPAATTPAQSVD